MVLLFASEIRDYLQPEMKEELFVDTSRTGKLKINIDINFHGISCDFLGLGKALEAKVNSCNPVFLDIYRITAVNFGFILVFIFLV